ncbi:MAG TPA: glycine zipper 2TM domain-containing protein [Pseudomonadales bacterium]|nr:glycine zipper 2TM domain-containing protein [Pseudomonadales bacterium]
MKNVLNGLLATALSVLLVACAAKGPSGGRPGEMEIRSGKIEQITPALMQTNHDSGVGAVLGGLGGLAIGSLIGGGTGRDVAMVAGTIGGAFAGNAIEKKKYDQPVQGQQVIVRVTSGVLVSITQPVNNQLRTGMKVYVEGSGNDARVVPQY